MYLDSDLYKKVYPIDSVIHFLSVTLKELVWYEGQKNLVMDVGCGPGDVTVKWILPIFSNLDKVIALDCLQSMIETAICKNCHPKVDYHTINFEDGSATERWRGQISHLISVNCFHWFKDQEKSFRLVYDVLQPGGKAACYFVLSSDYYDTVIQMENHPKWKSFLEEVDLRIPESYHKKYDSSHYQKLVEDIGFKVVLCRSEFKINRLPSHEAAKDLFYSICSVIPHIPEDQRHIFKDEFYRSLLDNGARDNDGVPLHRALTLEIVIQKPDFASDSKLWTRFN